MSYKATKTVHGYHQHAGKKFVYNKTTEIVQEQNKWPAQILGTSSPHDMIVPKMFYILLF